MPNRQLFFDSARLRELKPEGSMMGSAFRYC